MKTNLDRAVRETLREAARSARLDPHGWRPATSDVTPRRLRIRVPHPVRSRAVAVLVAAILIAGIGIPLAMLSRLGGGDEGGVRPGGAVLDHHGIRLELPTDWDGQILHDAHPALGSSFLAANFSLPLLDDQDVYGPFANLQAEEVVILLQEVTVEPLAPGSYPPLQGDPRVEPADVRRFGEGWANQVHSYARAEFSISGRQFNLAVGFGAEPGGPLIDELNAVLGTLEVEPANEPTGHRFEVDVEDGLSITIPAGWMFDANPTQPIEPENVFAFGSWDFPSGGVCAPFAALGELPADGVFVWMIEYHGTDHPEDFVPRSEHFDLRDFRFGETSCDPTPMYQLRFEDGGRFFQWQVAFGPQASEATEADTVLALDSLRVGGVCDTGNDGYTPEIAPASGAAGTEATLTGEVPHGEGGEGGLPADPTTWVEVWWNLDAGDDAWASALPGGEEPVPARPGPALRLGRVGVSGSCTYELSFSVPQAPPDTYPVVVLYGSAEGAAAFRPAHFEVTG